MALANAERGEVALDVGGKSFTLKLTTNAAATLQTRYKKSLGQLLNDIGGLDVIAIRGIFWCLLQKHHAKEFKTEEQVGDFIDDAGGLKVVMEAIERSLVLNNDPNPPTAQEATGTSDGSTSTPEPSA